MTGTTEQLAAVKRLKPSAELIYNKIRGRLNRVDKLALKTFYDNACDLAKVRTDPEKYGLDAEKDLPISLGMDRKTELRYIAVGKNITKEEMELYQGQQSDAGREFSATHLVHLASLDSVADRKRAWKNWIKESYSSLAFEDYISQCRKAISDASKDSEDSDADPDIAGTAAATGLSPNKAVKKLIQALKRIEPVLATTASVDLVALADAGDESVRETLEHLKALLTAFSSQATAMLSHLTPGLVQLSSEEAAARLAALQQGSKSEPVSVAEPKAVEAEKKTAKLSRKRVPRNKSESSLEAPKSVEQSIAATLGEDDPGTGPNKRRKRGRPRKVQV